MARTFRFEFRGVLYHVTSRGDRRSSIYMDETDRNAWLEILSIVCSRYNFIIHEYCQLTNHYHLLVEAVDAGLGNGLRQLNGASATAKPLADYFGPEIKKGDGIADAFFPTAYSMAEIAAHCGTSVRTVSRAIRQRERERATSGRL